MNFPPVKAYVATPAGQGGGEIEPAIELVLELSEVPMGIFGEVEGVIGAAEGGSCA